MQNQNFCMLLQQEFEIQFIYCLISVIHVVATDQVGSNDNIMLGDSMQEYIL